MRSAICFSLLAPAVCLLHVGMAVADDQQAQIVLSYVPDYGSFDDLRGQVTGVDHRQYGVAVYIYVGGWWTKPTFDNPLARIGPDGSFAADITTGGIDETATQFAAFVVPLNSQTPWAKGEPALPTQLATISVANSIVSREDKRRRIDFCGLRWIVKSASIKAGPGPNYFSNESSNVRIDEQGRLHLRMTHRDGKWQCAEVFTEKSFGYGSYTFEVSTPVDRFAPSVVLGLFTWDDAPEQSHREIDIEFSRWLKADNDNAQFVVQPWFKPENIRRFNVEAAPQITTHAFDWSQSSVAFRALPGSQDDEPGKVLTSWTYAGDDVPTPGNEKVRINLWLFEGQPPADAKEVEVVVDHFRFQSPGDN